MKRCFHILAFLLAVVLFEWVVYTWLEIASDREWVWDAWKELVAFNQFVLLVLCLIKVADFFIGTRWKK